MVSINRNYGAHGWSNFLDSYDQLLSFGTGEKPAGATAEQIKMLQRVLLRAEDSLRGGAMADWVSHQISSPNFECVTSFSLTSMLDVPVRILKALENTSIDEVPSLFQGTNFLHCLLDTIWKSHFSSQQQLHVPKAESEQFAHDTIEGIILLLFRLSNRGFRISVKFTLVLHVLKRLLQHDDRARWSEDIIRVADVLTLLIERSCRKSKKSFLESEVMRMFIEIIGWLVLQLPNKIHVSVDADYRSILMDVSRVWITIVRLVLRRLLKHTIELSGSIMDAFLHFNLWTYSAKEDFMSPYLETLVCQLKENRGNSFSSIESKWSDSITQYTVSSARRMAHFFYKEIIESLDSTDQLSVDIFQLHLLNAWSAHGMSSSRNNSIKIWLLSSISSASNSQVREISEKRVNVAIDQLEKPRNPNAHFRTISTQISSEYVLLFLGHLAFLRETKRSIPTDFILEAVLDGVSARFCDFDKAEHKNASLVGMQLSHLLTQSNFLGEKGENLQSFQVKEYCVDFTEWSKDMCYLDSCAATIHFFDNTTAFEPLAWEALSKTNIKYAIQESIEPLKSNNPSHISIQEILVHDQTASRYHKHPIDSKKYTLVSTANSAIAGMCKDEVGILQRKTISQLTSMVFAFERHSSTGHKDQSHVLRFPPETDYVPSRKSSPEFHEDAIVSLFQYKYIISVILPCKLAFTKHSTHFMISCASNRELLSSSEPLLRVLFYSPTQLPETSPCTMQQEDACICAQCSRNDLAALITARVPSIAIPYLCREYYAVSQYSTGEKCVSSPHTVKRLKWILNILYLAMRKIDRMEVSPLNSQETSLKFSEGSPLSLQETSLRFSEISLRKEQRVDRVSTLPLGQKTFVSEQSLPEIPRYPPRPHKLVSSNHHDKPKPSGELKAHVVKIGKVANRLRLPKPIDSEDLSSGRANSSSYVHAEASAFYEHLFLTLLPPKENKVTFQQPKDCFTLRYPFLLKNPILVAFQAKILTAAYQLVCAQQNSLLLRFFTSLNVMYYALHEFFHLLVQSPSDCKIEDRIIENIHPYLLIHILDCLVQVFSINSSVAYTQSPPWSSQFISSRKSSFLVSKGQDDACIIPRENTLPPSLRILSEIHYKPEESLNGVTEYWKMFTASVLAVYDAKRLRNDQAGKCFRLAQELHDLLHSSE